MKKLLALLLVAMLAFTLVACGGGETGTDEPAADNSAEVVILISAAGVLDDRAFNSACWLGIQDFCNETGKTYAYYQPTEDTVEAQLVVCDTAVKAGAKFIIINSDQFKLSAVDMQQTYPDVTFLMYDSVPTTADNVEVVEDNMTVIKFKEQEVGFLAGYAAVQDGYTKLGYCGGMPVPAVVRFGYGFVAGVDYAAGDLGVEGIELLYSYFGNFQATPDNQARCASWYQNGTEVIFVAAGPAGASAFKAAEDNNGLVIGVDSDQSGESETVISSAMKDLRNLTYTSLKQWNEGTLAGGTVITTGCDLGGVMLPMDTSKWVNFTQENYDSLYARLAADENGMASNIPDDLDYAEPSEIPVENITLTYVE